MDSLDFSADKNLKNEEKKIVDVATLQTEQKVINRINNTSLNMLD